MKRGTLRRLDSLATDGVERAEANGPPTAFRIWKAGLNVTDHGPTVFSERSAAALTAEQATRGNRYSIDVDHLSLNKDAPLANHAAVGWHSLEVRDGELWATNVEWSDAVRAGLTKDPPEWKYFSPAYDVDPETGEVVSYLNTALTNNPATHRVTALASRRARSDNQVSDTQKMSWGALKAALDGDDEDKKAAAYAQIAAAFPDEAPEKKDSDSDGDNDGDTKAKKSAEDEPEKKDGEDMPEKKDAKKCAEEEPEKKDSIATTASVVAAQDARIRQLEADAARRQRKDEEEERKRLVASREISSELAKALDGKPLEYVREICAALPPRKARPISTEHVQATRGGTADGVEAPRLPPEESNKLAERMGLRPVTAKIGWDPNMKTTRVFPALAAVAMATPAKKESSK